MTTKKLVCPPNPNPEQMRALTDLYAYGLTSTLANDTEAIRILGEVLPAGAAGPNHPRIVNRFVETCRDIAAECEHLFGPPDIEAERREVVMNVLRLGPSLTEQINNPEARSTVLRLAVAVDAANSRCEQGNIGAAAGLDMNQTLAMFVADAENLILDLERLF